MSASLAEKDETAAPEAAAGAPPAPARKLSRYTAILLGLTIALIVVMVCALGIGRYTISPVDVARILLSRIAPVDVSHLNAEITVVESVRLPRALLAMLIGGGLALTGAVVQALFRNPLASGQILGVSAGASFGGVMVLMAGLGAFALVGGAFAGGVLALVLVLLIARAAPGSQLLMLILGGTVIGAAFQSLVSLATYVADPYNELPNIVFWLMGSLATASYSKLAIAAVPILAASAVMIALRWRLNVLSMGDEDARAMGVDPGRMRLILLGCVALVTAGSVAVAGVVGWVGLVVPHLARMLVGTDNRIVLPATALLGAAYLTVIDTLARVITTAEIPIGILTAIVGAPFFAILLVRNRKTLWSADA